MFHLWNETWNLKKKKKKKWLWGVASALKIPREGREVGKVCFAMRRSPFKPPLIDSSQGSKASSNAVCTRSPRPRRLKGRLAVHANVQFTALNSYSARFFFFYSRQYVLRNPQPVSLHMQHDLGHAIHHGALWQVRWLQWILVTVTAHLVCATAIHLPGRAPWWHLFTFNSSQPSFFRELCFCTGVRCTFQRFPYLCFLFTRGDKHRSHVYHFDLSPKTNKNQVRISSILGIKSWIHWPETCRTLKFWFHLTSQQDKELMVV